MNPTKDPEYASLREEIAALRPEEPGQRGAMMLMAEMALSDARSNRESPNAREPHTSKAGYTVVWDTQTGAIGLWSCWLKDSFYLGWPNAWGPMPPEEIIEGFPSLRIGSRHRKDYNRRVGAYRLPLPESGEETSLDVGFCSTGRAYHFIQGKSIDRDGPPHVTYGWDEAETRDWAMTHRREGSFPWSDSGYRLFSEPYWEPEKTETEDLARKEWYSTQEECFIKLGCNLANEHGAQGATVKVGEDLEFSIVPENLVAMGFQTEWLRGTPGERHGWGSEVVYGTRPISGGGVEEVMLVSANSLVPWVCYRRKPVPEGGFTPEFIRELLTF